MPADVIDTPPAPAAPPKVSVAQQAAALPEIKVSSMPKGDPTVQPAKPGSAKARMFAELEKTAGLDPKPDAAPKPDGKESSAAPPDHKAADEPATKPGASDNTPEAPGKAADPEGAPANPPVDDKGKRISPWKLVDQFKQRAVAAETRALELEKKVIPEDKLKAETERVTGMEKRMKEMEEDLRYYNAEKYDPDVLKADSDYKAAFSRAMTELSELSVTDPQTQQTRRVNAEDMWELLRMGLVEARKVADAVFGPFAPDVMAHRKEIKALLEAKASKLDELKKTGATRDQQRRSQFEQAQRALSDEVQKIYNDASSKAMSDPTLGSYFKPREGDTEWNTRLEKGFKLVDEAYNSNAMNPSLTPSQRAEIVAKHAAVRNRAASWGALRHENEQLKAKLDELEKEVKKVTETTPAAGGREAAPGGARTSTWDQVRGGLAKYVRPA